jgi:hypothetical protein
MTTNIESLPGAILQVSRRRLVQIGPALSVAAAAGFAPMTAWAQPGYGPAGPKVTQLLRSDCGGRFGVD